jgi:O-antigen/teichoic acid export membrane protein
VRITAIDKALGEATVDEAASAAPPPAPHNRRRIAANFLGMASTGVLGLVVSILISVYVRRVLGPAAIGQVSWALAVLAYLTILVNPGLQTIGQRELAKNPARAQELVGLLLTLQTGLAVLVYGIVVAIAALDLRGEEVSYLLLIQGGALFLTAWNTGWVLQANERMVTPSIAALIFNALQFPVLFLFIHRPDDVYLYAALTLPFTLFGVIYNLWYAGHHGFVRPSRLRPTIAGAWSILREAWPLALSGGAILIYYNCDTIILGFTDGDAVVGQYATAYKLMLVAGVITAALWNAYFPALARAHDSPAQATLLSREYLGLLAWMGLPIAALGWACGRHVVTLMYGAEFAASGPYFEWLCLNIGVMFVNYGVVSTTVPWGHQALQFKITAAAAVVNLALNLIVIPLYGPWGAIATTIAAELVVLALGLFARRRLDIFWHPVLPIVGPPLLCSAAVALVIAALPPSFDRFWWLELLAGALVLGGCLLVFERRVVDQAMRLLRRAA